MQTWRPYASRYVQLLLRLRVRPARPVSGRTNLNERRAAVLCHLLLTAARLTDGKRIRFLDINDRLADADGRLRAGMTDADKLHLSVAGYQVWADALKPILKEILGPPAATDHAPPPTGDPSAPAQLRGK